MKIKNKMSNGLLTLLVTLSMVLVGCVTPKPAPSWPSGQERPINKAPTTVEKNETRK